MNTRRFMTFTIAEYVGEQHPLFSLRKYVNKKSKTKTVTLKYSRKAKRDS